MKGNMCTKRVLLATAFSSSKKASLTCFPIVNLKNNSNLKMGLASWLYSIIPKDLVASKLDSHAVFGS